MMKELCVHSFALEKERELSQMVSLHRKHPTEKVTFSTIHTKILKTQIKTKNLPRYLHFLGLLHAGQVI